jgi:hypothetical protein
LQSGTTQRVERALLTETWLLEGPHKNSKPTLVTGFRCILEPSGGTSRTAFPDGLPAPCMRGPNVYIQILQQFQMMQFVVLGPLWPNIGYATLRERILNVSSHFARTSSARLEPQTAAHNGSSGSSSQRHQTAQRKLDMGKLYEGAHGRTAFLDLYTSSCECLRPFLPEKACEHSSKRTPWLNFPLSLLGAGC